jgi:hypothetical protein
MAEQAEKKGDMKTKAAALSLAQKAALDILKVVTDNHWLVDEAFKVQQEEKKKKECASSLAGKERSKPIL